MGTSVHLAPPGFTSLIGGWSNDFIAAGGLIRPAALAMIEAYLASGHDVVLPELLANPDELSRFEACASRAGAPSWSAF